MATQANDSSLRSLLLVAESVAFTILVPGSVTVWLPWILFDGSFAAPSPWTALQYAALPLVGAGAVTYCWCAWTFVASGRGIPAPVDHPRRLVMRGPYRHVRNPMYLGVLFVLLGEVILFESLALLLYAMTWFGIVTSVVLLYEEPALRLKFGAEYEQYLRSVPRWLPGKPSNDVR